MINTIQPQHKSPIFILYPQANVEKPVPKVNQNTKKDPNISITESPILGTGIKALPFQIWSVANNSIKNLNQISEASNAQRAEDLKNGKNLFQGAKSYAADVSGFYNHLAQVDPSKLNRAEILPHLGELAVSYMQQEAGANILQAAKESYPQTMQELGKLFGLSGINSATTSSVQNQASLPGAVVSLPGAVANLQGAVAGQQSLQVANQQSATLGSIGGKVLGWAGAAYALYQIFKGKLDPQSGAISGAAAGAYIGSAILPGAGTLLGAVVGGVGGFFSGLFKTGKSPEQKERDAMRKQMQAAGILDNNWNLSLANGANFDIGKDGGAKLISKDGTQRKYTELDPSNPLTQTISQVAAPLANSISGSNLRLARDFTAYFTNAAISNSNDMQSALANLQSIYAKFGVSFERVLQQLSSSGVIKLAA